LLTSNFWRTYKASFLRKRRKSFYKKGLCKADLLIYPVEEENVNGKDRGSFIFFAERKT
jgi:hypothetical protein